MKNDDARAYFKNKGLDYSTIKRKDIENLKIALKEELSCFENPSNTSFIMTAKMIRKNDVKLSGKGVHHAFLRVKGTLDNGGKRFTHFADREAISFNSDGFIGFAGWADSTNVQPFISAFVKWCDRISDNKSPETSD